MKAFETHVVTELVQSFTVKGNHEAPCFPESILPKHRTACQRVIGKACLHCSENVRRHRRLDLPDQRLVRKTRDEGIEGKGDKHEAKDGTYGRKYGNNPVCPSLLRHATGKSSS